MLGSSWRARLREDLTGWQGVVAVLPAVLTYVLAAGGLQITGATLGEWEWEGGEPNNLGKIAGILLFTISHGFLPTLLFGLAWKIGGQFPVTFWLALGTLYGVPTLALAWETGWLPLLGVALHLLLSKRGTRAWLAVEYGCTSFFLLLFLGNFEGLFPWGALALLLQGSVLLLMHLTVRHLWIRQSPQEAPAPR